MVLTNAFGTKQISDYGNRQKAYKNNLHNTKKPKPPSKNDAQRSKSFYHNNAMVKNVFTLSSMPSTFTILPNIT